MRIIAASSRDSSIWRPWGGFQIQRLGGGIGNGNPWPSVPATLLTEDFRDLLLWIRAFNQVAGPAKAIRFYGFDVPEARTAYEWAKGYLQEVDPREAEYLGVNLWQLAATPWPGPAVAEADRQAWRIALARLQHRARARSQQWLDRSGRVAFARYQRCLVLLEQGTGMLEGRLPGLRYRESAMAENVRWILADAPPESRMLLWAHNGHLDKSPAGRADYPPMGWHLAAALGPEYLPIGLIFSHGSFTGVSDGRAVHYTVEPKAAGTLDRALAAAGPPVLALDLRRLPVSGRVARWFQAPQGTWSIPLRFDPDHPADAILEAPIAEQFDGLIFFARTRPTRLWP